MKVELNMSAAPTGVVFPFGRFRASLVERYPRRDMPCIGQLMNGIIAHVESPSLFYVLLLSDTQQLENLQNSLQNAIAAALQVPPPKSYKPGTPVAGYFNRFWYRAEVVEHIEGAPTAKVFYVDYGNTASQSLDLIRPLPPSLITLPPLALKCGLVGLKPHNQWSETESEVFTQLVLVEEGNPQKQLTVTMVGTTGRDQIAQVELFTDGRTSIGKLLPDLLKSKGFPDPSLATSAQMENSCVDKNSSYYIKGKCLAGCEAALIVGEEKTQLFVCKEQLAKASDYFRVMFFEDFKEKNEEHFQIEDETPQDMICFFNAIDPNPNIRVITEKTVQLLMRLTDKFQCNLLKEILKHHIQSQTITMKWLEWSLQYNMPVEIVKLCLNLQKIDDNSVKLLMYLANKFQSCLLKEYLKHHIEANGPHCKSQATLLNWLQWSFQYKMPVEIVKICVNVQKIDPPSVYAIGISIEPFMRLADEYKCDILKERLHEYIKENTNYFPALTLNWLILSVKYHMPQKIIKVCLPTVASLSLSKLSEYKEKIGLELYSQLLEAKCKVLEGKIPSQRNHGGIYRR